MNHRTQTQRSSNSRARTRIHGNIRNIYSDFEFEQEVRNLIFAILNKDYFIEVVLV